MARDAEKRIAASNTATLNLLRYGMLASNGAHLLFLLFYRASTSKKAVFAYVVTEAIALLIWTQLKRASTPRYEQGKLVRAGEDLAAAGLTQYLLDILYVTFATHILVALVWRKFWLLYLSIPGYAFYLAFTKIIAPRLGLGQASGPTADPAGQPTQSKRQAKLQARAESGQQRVRVGKR